MAFKYETRQIIPGDGWLAIYAERLEPGKISLKPHRVVCWALVNAEKGLGMVVPFIVIDDSAEEARDYKGIGLLADVVHETEWNDEKIRESLDWLREAENELWPEE